MSVVVPVCRKALILSTASREARCRASWVVAPTWGVKVTFCNLRSAADFGSGSAG